MLYHVIILHFIKFYYILSRISLLFSQLSIENHIQLVRILLFIRIVIVLTRARIDNIVCMPCLSLKLYLINEFSFLISVLLHIII